MTEHPKLDEWDLCILQTLAKAEKVLEAKEIIDLLHLGYALNEYSLAQEIESVVDRLQDEVDKAEQAEDH